MYVATGWLANGRPQSLLLIGEPSSGKTELLHRLRENATLHYASDLSVMGLHRTLKLAKSGAVTHVVATEFQKWFMRKRDAVQNLLGTLSQAMDEGVGNVDVGEYARDFGGTRIGFIGATTPQSFREQERFLSGLGFLSRTTAVEWEMPRDEVYEVMSAINRGDETDLMPVILPVPAKKVRVELPPTLSQHFQEWVWKFYRDDSVMRIFKRFRLLSMACALLDGRDVVHARDIEKVVAFEPYWSRMKRGSL
jgi:hypothetical protein